MCRIGRRFRQQHIVARLVGDRPELGREHAGCRDARNRAGRRPCCGSGRASPARRRLIADRHILVRQQHLPAAARVVRVGRDDIGAVDLRAGGSRPRPAPPRSGRRCGRSSRPARQSPAGSDAPRADRRARPAPGARTGRACGGSMSASSPILRKEFRAGGPAPVGLRLRYSITRVQRTWEEIRMAISVDNVCYVRHGDRRSWRACSSRKAPGRSRALSTCTAAPGTTATSTTAPGSANTAPQRGIAMVTLNFRHGAGRLSDLVRRHQLRHPLGQGACEGAEDRPEHASRSAARRAAGIWRCWWRCGPTIRATTRSRASGASTPACAASSCCGR